MDDRLALMDHGSFLGLRTLGHHPVTYYTWVYDRLVDLDAVGRFNENLTGTLVGRLVQRSALPFGRHRWVGLDRPPPIEVESTPRHRDQIRAWTDELGDRGIDPEHGPGWRIGVLPLLDGGTAVAMATSHTLGDGLCKLQAVADAVNGVARRPAYPVRGTRRRRDVLVADLVGFVRGVPTIARAVAAAVRLARSDAGVRSSGRTPVPRAVRPVLDAGPFHPPAACVRVRQDEWDEVAARLGGTHNTLLSAFAARLGDRFGRTDADGSVTLVVPVSLRVEGDTRGNALDSVEVVVDPTNLDRDLTGLRSATKEALTARDDLAFDKLAVLPLVTLAPPALLRRAEQLAMGAATALVGSSNHGTLDPVITRIDGADPDDFWIRLGEPGQTAAALDRIGGKLYVLGGRALDMVYLSVVAHPVGGGLEAEHVHASVAATLAEFGLTAAYVTP